MRNVLWIAAVLVLFACSGGTTASQDAGPDADAEGTADQGEPENITFADRSGKDQVDEPDGLPPDEENPPDTAPPGCEGEGCFLSPCKSDEDCLSGWCVEHMGEQVCTVACVAECPDGWSCLEVTAAGGDTAHVCVSAFANLCKPCADADGCTSPGGADDACIVYGPQGRFCGGSCLKDEDCPWGFSCREAQTTTGMTLSQCMAKAGECPCTGLAVEEALSTPCSVDSEWGSCEGQRVCTESGLSECDAAIPAVETCNGADDDCDGTADNPPVEGEGYANLCEDGNECTEDNCAGEDGCTHAAIDLLPCDDGDPCTGDDHCAQDVCKGKPVDCGDGNPCTQDTCAENGDCQHTPAPAACDDADPCTAGDLCAGGICTPGDPVNCADDNVCTDDACEPGVGCTHTPNQVPCSDGSLCTQGDECAEGMCKGGGPPNCSDGNDCTDDWCDDKVGCVYNVQSGACDDQNACTLDDQCTQGACGYGKLLACNDGNPCTDDACDPASGCVHVHNAAPCSDGDACTMDDTCQDGNCVPGKPFSCDDGEPCTAQSCDPETGCVFTPITVPVPTALSNSPECEGGVLLLAASGAEGVGWLWTGPDGFTSTEQNPALQGITPLAAGTYSVQAVIGECASEAVTVEVTVIPAPHGTKTFAYTGAAQAFAVPICITSITVDAYGAEGGASAYSQSTGGKGGRVQAVLTVTPGKSLQVVVGGKPGGQNGGYNGGGVGTLTGTGWPPLFYGGGGGGASDLRTGQFSLAERILVAGGGGGAGRDGSYPGCNGGAGGGETGGSGSKASDSAAVGTGGSQTEGGVAGGTLGEGGDGVAAQGGGGDGGGYYGGGGGARAGGGGGSSFAAPDSKDVVHTQGARAGNGEVKLTW